MRQKIILLLIAIMLFIGIVVILRDCDKVKAQEDNPAQQVKHTELIRTSQSWDGME